MRGRVQKWGNSLALRIPKSFADEKEIDLVSPNFRGCLFLTSPRIAFYHRKPRHSAKATHDR